jgi:hypothetical protein
VGGDEIAVYAAARREGAVSIRARFMLLVRPIANANECFAQLGHYAPYRRTPSGCTPTTGSARIHPPRQSRHQQRNGAIPGRRRGNRRPYLHRSTLVAAALFEAFALAVGLSSRWLAAGIGLSAWRGATYAEFTKLGRPARAGTALGLANTIVYSGSFSCRSPLRICLLVLRSRRRGVARPSVVSETGAGSGAFSRVRAGCCHSISHYTCV